jgi:hypothetical protein
MSEENFNTAKAVRTAFATGILGSLPLLGYSCINDGKPKSNLHVRGSPVARVEQAETVVRDVEPVIAERKNYDRVVRAESVPVERKQVEVPRVRVPKVSRIEKVADDSTQLILEREDSTARSTGGSLYLDKNRNGVGEKNEFLCYTLELAWKDNQRRKSCIPEGNYDLVNRQSSKFGKHYWVKDVPGRSAILVHVGNFPKDTSGCILVGDKKGRDYVGNSRNTFKKLKSQLGRYKNLKLNVRRGARR